MSRLIFGICLASFGFAASMTSAGGSASSRTLYPWLADYEWQGIAMVTYARDELPSILFTAQTLEECKTLFKNPRTSLPVNAGQIACVNRRTAQIEVLDQ